MLRIRHLAFGLLASALAPPAAVATEPANKPELSEADLGQFFDRELPRQLQEHDMAGAVVAVVRKDEVLFLKGYGYADVAAHKPVSAQETLFHIGSITKLFTWTAVMQLVERGELNLDADVNRYLDFRIPDTFEAPITLRALMTHTAGFEDALKDLSVSRTADLQPLGRYVASHIPRRLFPAGQVPAYSNYGAALAGYIVERVSGQSFEQYVTTHILTPLGMQHSTFDAAPDPALLAATSRGYMRASQSPRPAEILQPGPAGSLAATAEDMTRFMLAHLQEGAYGSARILQPQTSRLMHASQLTLHPGFNGLALGFYEQSRNGHRIIGHGGDSICFVSELFLLADDEVGFFVSYNSQGREADEQSPELLWRAFLDRYYPGQPAIAGASAPPPNHFADLSGTYLSSRRSDASLLRFKGAWQAFQVQTWPDGTLSTGPALVGPEDEMTRWNAIAPGVYRAIGGQEQIAFQHGPSGELTLVHSGSPTGVLQQVGWMQGRIALLTALVCAMTLLPIIAVTGLGPFLRSTQAQNGTARNPAVSAVGALALLNTILMIPWALFLLYTLNSAATDFDITPLTARLDGWLYILEALTALGSLGIFPAAWLAARAWFGSGRRLLERVHWSAALVAFAAFDWFALFYHLMTFDTRY